MLGAVAVLQTQLIGNIELGSPWAAASSGISLAFAISATIAEIALEDEAARSIKQDSDSKAIDSLWHKDVPASTSHHTVDMRGSPDAMANDQIFLSSLTDLSEVNSQNESTDEEVRKPHVFADPLAALFAPDVDDCDS
jgi:hypothetical protein